MKLQLNKKKLKNLSKDVQILPSEMTPKIGGGALWNSSPCAPGPSSPEVGCYSHKDCGSNGCISDPRVEACNTDTCY
jgi:hypothetical protein